MVAKLHRWGVAITGGGCIIAGGGNGCIINAGGGLSKGSGDGQQWWKMETSEDEGLREIFAVCACICIHIELPIFPNSISIY